MHNRIVKNLALLLFLNLLIKPFWILGIDRTVQNEVGEVMFGLYFSIYNFSYLFYILLDLGITNFNNRNIAQNNQLLSKHFSGIAVMKLLLGFLYALVIFIVAILYGFKGDQLYLLGWVAFNQILLSFILYIRSNISGLLLFKTDSFLSVLDRLLMICICGFLLWSGFVDKPFQLIWFVYAQTAAFLITLITAFALLIPHLKVISFSFNWPFIVMIIRRSLPFAFLVLLMSFYSRIEPVLLARLLPNETGLHHAGIYAQSFRLIDAGNNIALLFSVILLPMFSTMIKRKEPVKGLVKICFTLIILMSVTVSTGALFYSQELMELLYGLREGENPIDFNLRIREASAVFSILMGSFIAISSTYIFGTLLTANGSLGKLNIIAGFGVIINLTLNFILIPLYEAEGAAIASLSAQSITAILQFYLAKKLFSLDFGYPFWIRIVLFTAISLISLYFSKFLSTNWIFNLITATSFNLLSAIILGLIQLREVSRLFLTVARNKKD